LSPEPIPAARRAPRRESSLCAGHVWSRRGKILENPANFAGQQKKNARDPCWIAGVWLFVDFSVLLA
jgi:hypothetical protein